MLRAIQCRVPWRSPAGIGCAYKSSLTKSRFATRCARNHGAGPPDRRAGLSLTQLSRSVCSHAVTGIHCINKGSHQMKIPALALLLYLSVFLAGLYAQSEVGGATLSGTITDPSGAAVAGATVVAVDQRTGFSRSTASNEA